MEASSRPSELVNCPSSLFPWLWLLRMQAGLQAAKASFSGNLLQIWTLPDASSSRLKPGLLCIRSRKEHCWIEPLLGSTRQGKKCDFFPPFGSDRLPENPQFCLNSPPSRQSAGSHRPKLQRHQLILSQTPGRPVSWSRSPRY